MCWFPQSKTWPTACPARGSATPVTVLATAAHATQARDGLMPSGPSCQGTCLPCQLSCTPLCWCPITGNRLASVTHRRDTRALSFSQLDSWSSTAAATLSAIGCLCIADKRADSPQTQLVSHLAVGLNPLLLLSSTYPAGPGCPCSSW